MATAAVAEQCCFVRPIAASSRAARSLPVRKKLNMRPNHERLNPFVLSSETHVRFTLLMLTAVFLTLNLGFVVADQLGLASPATLSSDVSAASAMPALDTAKQPDGAAAYQRFLAENLALLRNLLAMVSFPLGLTLAMLALAFVLYRLHPRWVRASGKVQTLTPSQDAELADTIVQLAAVARVPPLWRVDQVGTFQTDTLKVIGFPKRYILRIGGQWRVLLRRSPQVFRVYMLHEFAHIANRDVWRTYFAQTLWVALVGLVIIPLIGIFNLRYAIITLTDLTQLGLGGVQWTDWLARHSLPLGVFYTECIATLLLVLALRRSLLRVRELYADWRVKLWDGTSSIEDVIARQPPNPADASAWRAVWRNHPAPAIRLDALRRSARLFRLAPDLAFFVGFLLALATANIALPLSVLGVVGLTFASVWNSTLLAVPTTSDVVSISASQLLPMLALIAITLVAAVILLLGVGYLLTHTLGVEVERAALADLAGASDERRPYLRLLISAALLALGVQVGALCPPLAPVAAAGIGTLPLLPLWMLALTGLTWLWLIFVYKLARAVLGTHTQSTMPTRVRRLCSLISYSLASTMLLPVLLSEQVALPLYVNGGMSYETAILRLLVPLLIVALVSYAAVAACTWAGLLWWRRRTPIRCPACGHAVQQQSAVGQTCAVCAADLAPWILIDSSQPAQPAAQNAHPPRRSRLVASLAVLGSIGIVIALLPAIVVSIGGLYSGILAIGPNGIYQVQGDNLQGQVYTGTLRIGQERGIYHLNWDSPAWSFKGAGVATGPVLSAIYGSPIEQCNLAAYQIQPVGMLKGRWLINGDQPGGEEWASPRTNAQLGELAGVYDLSEPGYTTGAYSGTLSIAAAGPIYQLSLNINGTSSTGTGIRQGDTLAAVYGAGEQCGLIVYRMQPDGVLDGRWTVYGATDVGTERAQLVQ
jgi:hypothetical protein